MPSQPAAVVVLYHHPKDPEAFERYYAETHVPLVVKHLAEIGTTRVELTKFVSGLDGGEPPLYRKAELWFESEADLRRGTSTAGFRAAADDLPNFATGGFSASIVVQTG